MKSMKFLFSLALIFLMGWAQAQITTPKPSPMGKVSQVFGLNEITIEYSRPGVKERKVFGELVPYGEVWRTGANDATKIMFEDDVTIEGTEVDGGIYSLFTIPGKDKWRVMINSYANASLNEYNAAFNEADFEVKPIELDERVERMTFTFKDVTDNSLIVQLAWEKTAIEFEVITDVDEIVMAEIDKAMAGVVGDRTYYDAAMYYYNTGKDLEQALEWMNQAIVKKEEPTFWMLHNKAKILADLDRFEKAILTAQESLELAKAAQHTGYIRLNERAIDKWSTMQD